MSKRFADNVDLDKLIAEKYSKKTVYTNEYAERILTSYIKEKKLDVDFSSAPSVDTLLCGFFPKVRKESGDDFSLASFISIRNAIVRILKDKHQLDIINDPHFLRSNELFIAMKSHLKKNGKGTVVHYPIITTTDLQKIADMEPTAPRHLQYKTWFTIHLHFALRGRENLHDLKRSDLQFSEVDGVQVLKLRDFQTKNHRNDTTPATEATIFSLPNSPKCPVQLINHYLSKLCPTNVYLWQKPRDNARADDAVWYTAQKVGVNTVNTFMKQLSTHLGLSLEYTNHSVRATSITLLGQAFQDNDVATFSGHKSLAALGIYKRVSNVRKQEMSDSLNHQMYGSCSVNMQGDNANPLNPPTALPGTLTEMKPLNPPTALPGTLAEMKPLIPPGILLNQPTASETPAEPAGMDELVSMEEIESYFAPQKPPKVQRTGPIAHCLNTNCNVTINFNISK
jgi:hypothetical protein